MSDKIQEGDEVSWKWGSGRPSGTVAEVVPDGTAEVTSNRGNTITRKGRGPEDPALRIERSGNDVVKLAHEVEKE